MALPAGRVKQVTVEIPVRVCDVPQRWKVNGAGGAGGSLSVLCRPAERERLADALNAGGHAVLDLRLAPHGARTR